MELKEAIDLVNRAGSAWFSREELRALWLIFEELRRKQLGDSARDWKQLAGIAPKIEARNCTKCNCRLMYPCDGADPECLIREGVK